MATQQRAARRERRAAQTAARRESDRSARERGVSPRSPTWVAVLAIGFVASGAAGLMHEVVWTRLLGHVFGVSSYAIATVLGAYMAGLALGSWWVSGRMQRVRDPRRLYAWLEIAIGACAALVPALLGLLQPLYAWLWSATEISFAASSAVRLVLVGALLLVPTSMMGATLPVLAEACARRGVRALTPEWLYTLNLFGAVLGVALAGFVFLPAVGVWATIVAASALNVGVGLVVAALPKDERAGAAAAGDASAAETGDAAAEARSARAPRPVAARRGASEAPPAALLLACAFASGLLSLGTQVAWNRVLVLVVGSTTYAFSSVLIVYLIALGLGGALASRYGDRALARAGGERRILAAIAGAFALAAVLAVLAVMIAGRLPLLYHSLYAISDPRSLAGLVLRGLLSTGIVVLPSVLVAGTILPLVLIAATAGRAEGTGAIVGRIYALNTVGSIAGSLLGGFLLVPLLGSQSSLLALAAAAALASLGLTLRGRLQGWPRPLGAVAALAAVFGLAVVPRWNQVTMHLGVFEAGRFDRDPTELEVSDSGQRILFHREGRSASVVVVEYDDDRTRSMRIDARTNASDQGPDMHTQVMLAQLPILLAPRAADVLVIGWGSGVTVGSALRSPAVERVTAVELEPAVVEASALFEHVNDRAVASPRVELIEDDARHVLLRSDATYDVIISEPSHPFVSGVANLFTRDFFEIAARRLREDGVFAQWVQTYGMPLDAWRSIVATFLAAFPEAVGFYVPDSSDVILIGARRDLRLDPRGLGERWEAMRAELARGGLDRPEHLLAAAALGPDDLRALAAGAPINTDDNMLVELYAAAGSIQPLRLRTEIETRSTSASGLLRPGDRWLEEGDEERRAAFTEGLERARRDPGRLPGAAPAS